MITRQRTDIEVMFSTAFPQLEPDVDIAYENSDFTPDTDRSWVRLSFTMAQINEQCISSDLMETLGIFSVQIFTSTAIGAAEGSRIADSVIEVLRKNKVRGVEFLDYSVAFAGQDSGWYYNIVRSSYRAYD